MDGVTNYREEVYIPQLESANEFQDFLCIQLVKRGIVLSNMSSKKYQLKIGENVQGFEIKLDHNFRKTGNLYIEYEEKSHPNNYNYVRSGIFRHDNSWIYALGDYEGIFLMQKTVLIAMFNKNRYKLVITETSKGMLLPIIDAKKYFNYLKL